MTEFQIRPATDADLPTIVAMLADDVLGRQRENPQDLKPYQDALAALAADERQHVVVADRGGRVVGVLQLSIVPGLARTAMTRGLIEGVRVHRDERGGGLGASLLEWAVAQARREGCGLVQLTSDATRVEAHRFYEKLGFDKTHYGFKLAL